MKKLLFTIMLCGCYLYGQAQVCTGSLTVTVTGSTTADSLTATSAFTQPFCNVLSGTLNGTIDITAAGGSTPYTFDWDDLAGTDNGANRTGLGTGDYSVIVTDVNGCSVALGPFSLVEPTPVTVMESLTQLDCNSASGGPTGAIDITPGGGTVADDYTYAWSTTNGGGLDPAAQNQSMLEAGDYTVVVTDDNGCSVTDTYTLTEPTAVVCSATSPILGSATTNILCAGGFGTINVSASGGSGSGYTYSLDGGTAQGSSTFTEVLAGTYTVTTTDGNGCTSTCQVTLTEPTTLVAGSCDYVQDLCQLGDGEIKIEVSGGAAPYEVAWSASPVAPNTIAGVLDQSSPQDILTSGGSVLFSGAEGNNQYSFIVTDDNGCQVP